MIWVVRAGKNGILYDQFITSKRVFLTWDGYAKDLSLIKDLTECRRIVAHEKGTDNKTSISNWAGQLFSFLKGIQIGDYVLIPSKNSRTYTLAAVKSSYRYDEKSAEQLHHYREIEVLETNIPRSIFSQSTQYSLNAFRTIFKAKNEETLINTIKKWKEGSR